MKKGNKITFMLIAAVMVGMVLVPGQSQAGGWDFYFFGVNARLFKEADYRLLAAGVASSLAVHVAGHYAYAGLHGMKVRQHGFKEIVPAGYAAKRYREFAQAGFVAQHAVGLLLTSLPITRHSDFTRGYVALALAETVTYPALHRHEGDLHFSHRYGGNRDLEFAAYSAVAIHNVLRVKWYKE